MKINILAGGPEQYLPDLLSYHHEDTIWVGVDRGVLRLINLNITPIAFGDFDSVSLEEKELVIKKSKVINQYRAEKDETDMELAFEWALSQAPSCIRIFGATGGRADHYFANAFLLSRQHALESGSRITIIDNQNEISVHGIGEYKVSLSEKKYISFIPISPVVEGITLSGFKYPLRNKRIERGTSLCISNELIQESGTFSFTKGILMMIRSQD